MQSNKRKYRLNIFCEFVIVYNKDNAFLHPQIKQETYQKKKEKTEREKKERQLLGKEILTKRTTDAFC